MKNLLRLSMLVATISAGALQTIAPTVARTTTGPQWHNLDGKMVTLSQSNSGISFAPSYFPWLVTSSSSYSLTTIPHSTPGHTIKGVSVCLGYMIDLRQSMYRLPYLFTLSPSNPLILGVQTDGHYTLFINGERVSLSTDIFLLPNIGQTPWTKICLNIDLEKNVVQMFSGRQASVRKLLPISHSWLGQPVIEFSGFDGQVTDVQLWDYPLSYKEILGYMHSDMFGRVEGSVLKWSNISYSVQGNVLLENTYKSQLKKPVWEKWVSLKGKRRRNSRMGAAKKRF